MALRSFFRPGCPSDVLRRLSIPLTFCAAAAVHAAPPLPSVIVPDAAQERLQAQIALQQAQSQARLAAEQAKVQAQLNANQAKLEGQLAQQQAGTQAQLNAARQSMATAPMAQLPSAFGGSLLQPMERLGQTMQLITLTPRLGSYFGTEHGVLVLRAPAAGALKLEDGDVILTIGGRAPASSSQAIRILTSYDPGEKISLVVLRAHHRLNITATLPPQPGR